MGKTFVTDGVLQHGSMHYHFQLENISMTGTVVKLKWDTREPILAGDSCLFMCYKNMENEFAAIPALVVHYSFCLVALQFIDLDPDTEQTLVEIIEKVTANKICKAGNSSGLHHLKLE